MKTSNLIMPLVLAFVAAIGNAIVTLGQKKADPFPHPFLFGGFSLLFASTVLFALSFVYPAQNTGAYIRSNLIWFATAGVGLVLLNIFLYILYRDYGAAYYTLYAVLAIFTTSIALAVWLLNETMNLYYGIALGFAALTIFFFMKGRGV